MIMNLVYGGKTPSGTRRITSNGTYDVTDYESVDVDVPAEVDEPVLLWTNANPASEFAAQTVNVSGGAYSAYLVEVAYSRYYTDALRTNYLDFTTTPQMVTGGLNNDNSYRPVTNVDSNGITFSGAIDNARNYAIPVKIYGVKISI